MIVNNETELRIAILQNKPVYLAYNIDLFDKLVISSNHYINGNGKSIKFIHGGGIIISGNRNTICNLNIFDSERQGILISGHHNKIKNVLIARCEDAGLQIFNGGHHNKIINCNSCYNSNDRGSADGFACKLGSGKGNIFIGCSSYNNGDDGFDLFAAAASVKLKKCEAYANSKNGTGSGFKLGGFKKTDDLRSTIHHKLSHCISHSNGRYGFSSNNQIGTITLKNCTSYDNAKGEFFFPKVSHPKAINKGELILGDSYLVKCIAGGICDLTGSIVKDVKIENTLNFLKEE